MDKKLQYLMALGFQPAGAWSSLDGRIYHDIPDQIGNRKNVLYAFVADESPAYIGMTINRLKDRLRPYAYPPKSGHNGGGTNIKNNRNIREALRVNRPVGILFLPGLHPSEDEPAPSGSLLHLMEAQLRAILRPPWNDC
jgi:hypothetical protein